MVFGNLNARERESTAKEVSELSVQFIAYLQDQKGLDFFTARNACTQLVKEVLGSGGSPDAWANNLVTSDRQAKQQSQLWKQYEQFRGGLRRQAEPTNITIDKDRLMVWEPQDLVTNPDRWKDVLFEDIPKDSPKDSPKASPKERFNPYSHPAHPDHAWWMKVCAKHGTDPRTGKKLPEGESGE
jgi:hypothetical protein